jgi:hypothetical protein
LRPLLPRPLRPRSPKDQTSTSPPDAQTPASSPILRRLPASPQLRRSPTFPFPIRRSRARRISRTIWRSPLGTRRRPLRSSTPARRPHCKIRGR